MTHHCHAWHCTTPVPPEMLMCRDHWRMVPKDVQRAVWDAYRVGQCDDMEPSFAWHYHADRAILSVALREGYITSDEYQERIVRVTEAYAKGVHGL